MKTRTNFGMTVKQACKKIENRTLRFDNSVQRGYVWDKKKQCAMIDTLLSIGKWIPTPPVFVIKSKEENEEGKEIEFYDCLDGKQRWTTIYRYKNNEFALEGLNEIELEDGNTVDVNGKKFEDLPEELQDRINDYSITFNSLEGVTDEEIADLFCRLNNGKPLSAIELTRVHAKSRETIQELAKHTIFEEAMTDKALKGFKNEDVVVKSLIIMNEVKPCMDTKFVRPYMERTEITEQDKLNIQSVFDRLQAAHDRVAIKEDKLSAKIAKRIYTQTHMITLAKITLKSINIGIEISDFTKWIEQVYNGTKSPTNMPEYNNYCSAGSGKEKSVMSRMNALEKNFNEYFKIESKPQLEDKTE